MPGWTPGIIIGTIFGTFLGLLLAAMWRSAKVDHPRTLEGIAEGHRRAAAEVARLTQENADLRARMADLQRDAQKRDERQMEIDV